ncbi:MAG: polysaccharide biosynthesis protein [Lysobacterales bacterium 14-68-21]|jgi:O-antigen/teichoic acid export membrane protein|nr:MAG: polysaccharide biosynthesis protein [Xanthomonadales bacterium 15-68-25]OZB66063.1 MAG: polysaccharide biosynthesis protein [Xanthomonadales bacterium 14-68-21]
MNDRRLTLRNTLFSSIGIYAEYFLGMVAAIIIARHLGPNHYGIYSMFIWFAAIGIVVTNSGITTGVIKFISEFRGSGREAMIHPLLTYMRRVQAWHMVLVIGAAAAGLALAGQHLPHTPNLAEAILLAAAVAMRAPYMFNIAIAKGFEAFDATAKVSMLAAPLNLLLVVGAVLAGAPMFWFLVVYAGSSGIFLASSALQARRLLAKVPMAQPMPDELRQRVRHHLRVVSVTVVVGFLIASDVEIVFLNTFATASDAGYFKVAYQLATGMMLLVPGVFGAVLLPMMSKALSRGRDLAAQRFVAVTVYLVMLSAPVVVFGMCFAGPIIRLLYGTTYAAAAPVFAVAILASALSTANQGAISLLVSADRQRTILLMTVLFGTIKLSLDALLIHQYALRGAVVAILTEAATSTLSYVLVALRVSGARMDVRRLGAVLLASVGAACVSLPVLVLEVPALVSVLLGGIMVLLSYGVLTLLLPCWSSGDIAQLQELHRRFANGWPGPLRRLLQHAGARAERAS